MVEALHDPSAWVTRRFPGAIKPAQGRAKLLDMRHRLVFRLIGKKKALNAFWRKGFIPLLNFGSPNRARTCDLRINSPSLYRLSYRGKKRNYST